MGPTQWGFFVIPFFWGGGNQLVEGQDVIYAEPLNGGACVFKSLYKDPKNSNFKNQKLNLKRFACIIGATLNRYPKAYNLSLFFSLVCLTG